MLNPSQTSRLLHGFRFEAPWESLRVGNGARWYKGTIVIATEGRGAGTPVSVLNDVTTKRGTVKLTDG
ncbi:hypothetical protein EPK84_12285 (plasmid) [Sinorhizobium fredii]|nr:hypothetical protein EPK84_12285 [Sinorhizobium fredii]